MLLAINANNTNTVFALWDGAILQGAWRAATEPKRTADEYVVWLDHLLSLAGFNRGRISGTIIASVVPDANFNLVKFCQDYCASTPLMVGEPGIVLGMKALVDRPDEVGADRLINTVAVHDRYPGAAIVVIAYGLGAGHPAYAWLLVVETIVTAIWPTIGEYLPGQAATALEDAGRTTFNGGVAQLLPWWGGAVMLVVYGVALAFVGTSTTLRSDIT